MIPQLEVDPALQWALRLALAAVLLQSAAHKLRGMAVFAAAIRGYRLLPEKLSVAAAATFTAAELAIDRPGRTIHLSFDDGTLPPQLAPLIDWLCERLRPTELHGGRGDDGGSPSS